MLADAVTIVRLSIHVLAATVWVGGQFALAGLVPVLRRGDPSIPSAAARRFAQLAWPAYVVLLGTGIWNVAAVDPSKQSGPWRVVLWVKIAVVLLAGISAWMHQRARGVTGLAFWGAVTGVAGPAAVVLGVALAG